MPAREKLEPLKISCSRSECGENLHCFRRTRRMCKYPEGQCQSCGAKLIDWTRVQSRDLCDIEHTFRSLKYEWIRHYFWEAPLTQRIVDYARRKGRNELESVVEKRIRKYVAKSRSQLFRDGTQTPFEGPKETIVTRAQHAVACCCRKCIEYWHGIPVETPLTDEHVQYFKELALMYIDDKLLDLSLEPTYVSRATKK